MGALKMQDGRARILSAAVRSFSELGYYATTTADVAREAGVTQPLVHHHFGSKDGLWRAAVDHLFADVKDIFAFEMDASLSPVEVLRRAATRFVMVSAKRPEIGRIVAREGTTPGPRLTYLLDHHVREPLTMVAEALRAARNAGVIAKHVHPEMLLFLMLGAGSHLFDVPALADEVCGIDTAKPRTASAFATLFVDVMLDGILAKKVHSV